jgi:E3 ubiquitin-protein ligase RNF115/126
VEEKECGICIEEFKATDQVVQLPCKHSYHENCGVQWLEINNKCPKCRAELPSEEVRGPNII